MMLRLGLILALLATSGCPRETPTTAAQQRLRVLIPGQYKDEIEKLLKASPQSYSFAFDDIDWVDMPRYKGSDQVFAASLAGRFADTKPDADVFFIDLFRIGSFRPAWLTRFDTGALGDLDKAFRPAFLRATKLGDDAVYAIPWSAKGNFLFYRKDLVKTPPRTFADLRAACAAIDVRRLPATVRYCLLLDWGSIQNDLYPVLWSLAPNAPVDLASEPVVTFFNDLAVMLGEPLSSGFMLLPPASQIAEVGRRTHARFARGEAVFMINWNNRIQYMKGEVGDQLPLFGMAPIPTIAEGGTPSSNIGSWGWVVPQASEGESEAARKRHALALEFVREISSAEAVSFLVEHANIIPARRDVALPAELKSVLSPAITQALEGEDAGAFRFRDRGSDSFVHTFIQDAIRDLLMCRTAATKPLPTAMLGDCARYLEECSEAEAFGTDCLRVAIRRRLKAAQRQIEAARR